MSMPSAEFDEISGLIERKKYEEALSRARLRLKDPGGHALALTARALLEAERFDECRAMLPDAIRAAPDLDWLHRFDAILLRREKKLPAALSRIHHALTLGPGSPSNYELEAHILVDLGRIPDAIAALEDGLAIDARNEMRAPFERQLGRCYSLLGRFAEAEKHLRRAIELSRSPAWQFELLADALDAREKSGSAYLARALAVRERTGVRTELPGAPLGSIATAAVGSVVFLVAAIIARIVHAQSFALVSLAIGFGGALLAWSLFRTRALRPVLDDVDEQLWGWWGGQRA